MARIALNGLGRIGKLVLRDLVDSGIAGEIVLLNDPAGTAGQHALLMEFDSVHGRWRTPVAAAGDAALSLNGRTIRLNHEKTIEALPLAALGVDLVIDCTGVFKTAAKVAPYFAAGVAKVAVSAPVKDGGALNLSPPSARQRKQRALQRCRIQALAQLQGDHALDGAQRDLLADALLVEEAIQTVDGVRR